MNKLKIQKFSVCGYKAFPEPKQSITLAPVTIVIGHNNAGKSALVRSPVLWADSLDGDSQFLKLNTRSLDFAQSYADLFRADAGHPTMQFAFELRNDRSFFDLEVELGLVSTKRESTKRLTVNRFYLGEKKGDESALPGLPIEMLLEFQKDSGQIKFIPSIAGTKLSAVDNWSELLPLSDWMLKQLTKHDGGSATISLLMQLRKLGSVLHHLGPFRKLPQRQYQSPVIAPAVIGSDGSNIVELLAWDKKNASSTESVDEIRFRKMSKFVV